MSTSGCLYISENQEQAHQGQTGFQADRAYQDVIYQTNLGARIPGTDAHRQVREWITSELKSAGWDVRVQSAELNGKPIINLIASRGQGLEPAILIGAHYDSRILADHDPDQSLRSRPVPGANDGASGVAILLELSRSLPKDLPNPVQLIFFDAEDNGGIDDWDWILGSQVFVEELAQAPQAVIIVDMVGDSDLQLYYEKNSDPEIRSEIWAAAQELGYADIFIPEEKYSMLDDHTPFLEAGIPAVDIIDFDYPYWHTTADTADKVSAESLGAVGETLTKWLTDQAR